MSDVLKDLVASGSQTVGPFFHFGLTEAGALGTLAGHGCPGERITLRIRVTDGAGEPVPDAMIEIWQADADGQYASVTALPAAAPRPAFVGYGRLGTNADGVCVFETVKPGVVSDGAGGRQAPHINVCFFARGLLRQIHTRIYFEGDAGLATDPALHLVPADRRETLLARRAADASWEFALRLQGDRDTVFFDL